MNRVKLPVITPSQAWVCSKGCGDCTPEEQEFVLQRVLDRKTEELLSELISNTFVSSCCKEDLLLYDEATGGFVDYYFVETQVGPTRKVYSTGIKGKSPIHA